MSGSTNRPRSPFITIGFCCIASCFVSACSVSSDNLPRFTLTVDPPLKTLVLTEQKLQ